ncbi:MAG: UDP-N-acetylglucosamine 2-epimerase (non-hydrolyzing) [Streptosporangiales bacterium]|nr:UDP-N-acetylglucosamine 2-epimerase (non-hydrolyzing) [Streptosporangiales bacterium]
MLAPIVHVLGARPNFVKAAPVIDALRAARYPQSVVHTGQHYDERLSDVFFAQLGLPEPDVNLGIGSGSHAEQTAAAMVGLEREFLARSPGLVVVYGDVNSTLAAALVAAKLHLPVAHVEAGLRSFDETMPEEINRRLTDQLCELLFTTSPEAVGHLVNEGVDLARVHFVGNPMIDTLLANLDRFDTERVRRDQALPDRYAVATLHRPANVDDPEVASTLVRALHEVAASADVVIPVHPRGRATLEAAGLSRDPRVHVREPLSYVEFVALVRGAAAVITDSGGVQEETTVLGVPCLTLRPNTERPITISHGTNRLVTYQELVPAARKAIEEPLTEADAPERPPLWDGRAGARIASVIAAWMERDVLR